MIAALCRRVDSFFVRHCPLPQAVFWPARLDLPLPVPVPVPVLGPGARSSGRCGSSDRPCLGPKNYHRRIAGSNTVTTTSFCSCICCCFSFLCCCSLCTQSLTHLSTPLSFVSCARGLRSSCYGPWFLPEWLISSRRRFRATVWLMMENEAHPFRWSRSADSGAVEAQRRPRRR